MSTHTIKVEQEINASPEQVFTALSNANEIEKWFATKAESNPKAGGAYALDFRFIDPEKAKTNDHVRKGIYTVVEPGKQLSYNWLEKTTVNFYLSKASGGTKLTLEHTGWDKVDVSGIEAHTQGWGFFLQNLKSLMESGNDMRAEMLGLKTSAMVEKA